MTLRRPLFGWEKMQWDVLLAVLECFNMNDLASDSISWVLNPDGRFSVGSFRRSLEDFNAKFNPDHLLIWQGLCPPKVEMFLWQLFQGRVMVHSVMNRFGFVPGAPLVCVLCNSGEESIDHLFLHCPWSKKLWLIDRKSVV